MSYSESSTVDDVKVTKARRSLTSLLDGYQRWMCRMFVNKPELMFVVGFVTMCGICSFSAPQTEITENSDYDWTVSTSQESAFQDMTTDLLSKVDAVGTIMMGQGKKGPNAVTALPERSVMASEASLSLVYESTTSESIYSPEGLQVMCETESVLYNHPDYVAIFCEKTDDPTWWMPPHEDAATAVKEKGTHCRTPRYSLVPRFYGWPPFGTAPTRACTLLSQDRIATILAGLLATLADAQAHPEAAASVAFFIDVNANLTTENFHFGSRTRSFLALGGPLKDFDNLNDRAPKQQKVYVPMAIAWEAALFEKFSMKKTWYKSYYRDPAVSGTVSVRFFSLFFGNQEFNRVVNGDLLWTFASILFVFCYMVFHTGSFFLSTIGIIQIIFSLPIAYFIYRWVFGIAFYTQLHILTIFLVLGVGADDIFVLTDAWKQAGDELEYAVHPFHRLYFAYKRAFGAIFNTSFTTAMAFLSTAFSPVMPISAFGIYASTAILINYLYVVLFTPAAVMLHYKYFADRRTGRPPPHWMPISIDNCAAVNLTVLHLGTVERKATTKRLMSSSVLPLASSSPTKTKTHIKTHIKTKMTRTSAMVKAATTTTTTVNAATVTASKPSSYVEAFFTGPYTRAITYRPTAVACIIFFAALSLQGCYFATQLSPPQAPEEWFASDHMSSGFQALLSTGFRAGSDDSYVRASFIWGADTLDRRDFSRWEPALNRGTTVLSPTFDTAFSASSRTLFHRACQALRKAPCDLAGCMTSEQTLVKRNSVECWLETLEAEQAALNQTLPSDDSPDAMLALLSSFRQSHPHLASSIGITSGTLVYVRLPFVLTLVRQQPFEITMPVNIAITSLLNTLNDDEATLAADNNNNNKDNKGKRLGPGFVEAGRTFAWIRTEEGLVNGMIQGLGICFPVAFLVLLGATGNLLLALYAVLSITGIVGTVLGFCESVMGWHLGVAESVAAVIVIGFSVDYVVHLASSYQESVALTRLERTSDAVQTMGATVLAGAITTLGAGLFMFGCQMVFFTKMALLMSLTIVLSLAFSLAFFMALCSVAGPEGTTGQLWSSHAHDRETKDTTTAHDKSKMTVIPAKK